MPAQRTTSGLAIAGFVLAFLIAPLGFVLSIIGAATTGARSRQKGRGLAIAGIIVSLLIMGGTTAIIVVVATKVDNITTIADPGCIDGKKAILDNADAVSNATDADASKKALQGMIDGLKAAADEAKHDSVRDAMNKLADDYKELLDDVDSGTGPDSTLMTRITDDANQIDSLCTLGS